MSTLSQVLLRLRTRLVHDFPRTCQVLGDEAFSDLVRDFYWECPSRSFQVEQARFGLPEWVEGWLESSRHRERTPFLGEVARAERAIFEALQAPRIRQRDVSWVRALPEDLQERLILLVDPSVRLLRTRWQIQNLWLDGASAHPASVAEQASFLLLYRKGRRKVQLQNLPSPPFRFLELAQKGWELSDICRTVSGENEDLDGLISPSSWMGYWVKQRIVMGVRL